MTVAPAPFVCDDCGALTYDATCPFVHTDLCCACGDHLLCQCCADYLSDEDLEAGHEFCQRCRDLAVIDDKADRANEEAWVREHAG